MTLKTLSCPTASKEFPAGTTEEAFVATVTGTDATGAAFSQSYSSSAPTVSADLPAGTYSYVISKNGISSLASDSFSVTADTVPVTVIFSVPDATQKAVTPA